MYKVLIVDDERMIREGMRKVIPWEELEIDQVITAASGSEALEIIEQEMPDIMITDISMAEMTGLELIEKVLETAPELRILVLTGYDSFEYARECLRLRVQDFLLKPIDENLLTECISKQVAYLKEEEKRREKNNMLLRTEGISAQIELEKTMSDLVHGEKKEEAVKLIEEQFNLRRNRSLMIAVLMPEQDIGYAKQDEAFRFRQTRNICLSVIDTKGLGITFSDGDDDKIIIALYVDKCGSEGANVISDLLGILKDEFGSAPKAAIGNEVIGFENIDTSYQDAIYLLQNDKMDIHQILQTQNVIKRSHMFQEVYEELKNEMCANVSDYPYVMHVFDAFCMATKSYNLSGISVRKFCFELLADIYYAYIAAGGTVKDQKLEKFMESLNGADGAVSLELSKQYLMKMLGGEEKDVHEIVGKAKRYINSHLADDLSVSNIAEILFVSPNYFSRLFKRVTGQGCNEYIVRKRIEKACVLLGTTNFNTGKIAGMVGYNDTNYFSMAFKKHCGVSPTRYRSEVRNQKNTEQ